MVKGRTTLIALAVAMLIPGAARHARADQTGDDRDRAVVAHSRDRSATRVRPAGSGPEAASSVPLATQDPQLLCDRSCLQSVAESYLKAVVAHDPKLLALDDRVRFTENGQELQPGDGFWNTASGVGAVQQFYADPQTQQITYIGTMREFDNVVLMALRLKVHDRRLSEAETLFYRKGAGPAWSDAGIDAVNARGTADSAWLTPIPVAQRGDAGATDGHRPELDERPRALRRQGAAAAQRRVRPGRERHAGQRKSEDPDRRWALQSRGAGVPAAAAERLFRVHLPHPPSPGRGRRP